MLSHKVRAAAIHFAATLKDEGLDFIAVHINNKLDWLEVGTVDDQEMIKNVSKIHNPIQGMIDNVLQEICTDCLKLDYQFADPFFVSLVKGYIEVLFAQYGAVVPVTRTLAQVCLKYQLTEHHVCYKSGEHYMFIDDVNAPQFGVDTTQFFLASKSK